MVRDPQPRFYSFDTKPRSVFILFARALAAGVCSDSILRTYLSLLFALPYKARTNLLDIIYYVLHVIIVDRPWYFKSFWNCKLL